MGTEGETGDDGFFYLPIQIALLVIAIVSSILSLFIPALYYIQQKFKEHPARLIAIISLLEAVSNYNIILYAFSVYEFESMIHIKTIFDLLVFYRTGEPSDTEFCEVNFTIYILLQLTCLAYNICFSVDLLITLKKPFFSGKKRMKLYNLFCFVVVVFGLPLSIVEAEEICSAEFHKKSIYKIPTAFLIFVVVFYLVSFVIIVMSFISVQTSQIRIKYIRFHRIILLVLVLMWVCPLVTNLLIRIDYETGLIFRVFNLGSFFSLVISGGAISIIRFYNDPFIWAEVKRMIFNCSFFKTKKVKEQEEDSAMNEESIDIWNLPLAQAVSTFHHQSVVSNIIEIVLETCDNQNEEVAIMKSEFHHEAQDYEYEGSIIGMKEIRKYLKSGDRGQIKRLIKMNKTFEMVCLEKRESNLSSGTEKSIYKKANLESDFGQKEKNKLVIQVKSYADPIFLSLRLHDGITFEELSKTLNLSLNNENIKKARESLGASGSFFFFSYDNRLVIKTINEKECKVFLKFLPEYYEHIVNNPSSLISRAYGLFEIEIAGISKIYFMMMENTLKSFEDNGVLYKKYDLKGSTIKREVKNVNADVFKDINYLSSDDAFLVMSRERKRKLVAQISADVNLLSRQNIMDYSLLLGVGHYKKMNKRTAPIFKESDIDQNEHKNEWRCFDDGHELTTKIYSLSLIDYLQEFDASKYMELKLKKVFKGGGDISSVDTQTYLKRFQDFVNRIIVVQRV